MNRTIGIMMLVAAVGAVQAQEPPTPPARPARPAEVSRPAPAPRVYAPVAPRPAMIDEMRIENLEAARIARDAARDFERDFERDFSRAQIDEIRAE